MATQDDAGMVTEIDGQNHWSSSSRPQRKKLVTYLHNSI